MERSVNVNAVPSRGHPYGVGGRRHTTNRPLQAKPQPARGRAFTSVRLVNGASAKPLKEVSARAISPTVKKRLSTPQLSRRALGHHGLLAVLWPVLADLIRELIRLLR